MIQIYFIAFLFYFLGIFTGALLIYFKYKKDGSLFEYLKYKKDSEIYKTLYENERSGNIILIRRLSEVKFNDDGR